MLARFRLKVTSMRFKILTMPSWLPLAVLLRRKMRPRAKKVFQKCRACHQVGETAKNGVGPVLNGLLGRKSGTSEGYSYTEANKNSGITWDEAVLAEYLKNPKAKIPGTKMIFPGLPKDDEIVNLIAFLKQYGPDGKKS